MSNEIKLRKLKARDIGPFSKILSKMDIKDDVGKLFQDTTGKTEDELKAVETKLAVELLFLILENYWKAEEDFFKFLASLSDKSVEDMKDSLPNEIIETVKQLAKDESFQIFFKLVA